MGSRTCMFEPGKRLGFCTGPSNCDEKDDPQANGTKGFNDGTGRRYDGHVEFIPSEGMNYKNVIYEHCNDCKK